MGFLRIGFYFVLQDGTSSCLVCKVFREYSGTETGGGGVLEQPTSLEQFCKLASRLEGEPQALLVSQEDYTPEESIVSDEDTAGGVNMQIVRLLAITDEAAVYWSEPISDSGELEQMNIKLNVLERFPRSVVTENELTARKNELGIEENSIQQEAD